MLDLLFKRCNPPLSSGMGCSIQVHSKERFDMVLHRERERVQNTGVPFTLVAIEAFKGGMVNPKNRDLIKCLIARTRLTDDIGWMDTQQIGVVLFDATIEDARRYIQLIGELNVFKKNIFRARIYNFSESFSYSSHDTDIENMLTLVSQVTIGREHENAEVTFRSESGKYATMRGY